MTTPTPTTLAEDNVFVDLPSSASSDGSLSDELDLETQLQKNLSIVTPLSPPGSLPRSPTKPRRLRSSSTSKNERIVQCGTRTLYTSGRPPWYDSHGEMKEAFVIGLAGGSASGKTTVARRIIEALDVPWVSVLSLDSFYKVLNEEEHDRADRCEYDFDHPDSFDFDLVVQTLKRLKRGKSVHVPVYNFKTHNRDKQMKTIYGANVVIFEGILAFNNKALLDLMDMKIFVDTDADVRLARRLRRDISERQRDLIGVIKQYNTFVKPSYENYIEPTMCHADIIVPRGGENDIALNLIVNHVHTQLLNRGFHFRSKLPFSCNGQKMPDTLHLLENTKHVQSLHTIVRNSETPRDEFIFYSNRLMRLLIEFALSMLPHKDFTVETPQGFLYTGRRLDCNKICGVSILRAGETLEPALCEVIKDIRLGKILIQTNHSTEEPELHYLRLIKDIKDHHVMLMDATVATGAAAVMAIRVLLDHDVPQENITLVSLLMGETGVHTVAYAFPRVKLVTTAVDREMNDKFHIIPGIGNFGDRYFGTDDSPDT